VSAINRSGQRKLYRDLTSILLLRTFQLITGLISIYFIARSLSKTSYGEYNMILNMIGLLGLTALTGLNNSLVQSVARGYLGTYKFVVPIAFGGSVFGGAGLMALGIWQLLISETQIALGFMIAAILFPFAHGLTQWKSVIIGEERFRTLFLYESITSFINCTLVVICALIFPEQYIYLIFIVLIVPSVCNVVFTTLQYRNVHSKALVEPQSMKYGIRTTIYSGLGAIGSNIDRILIFLFLSPTALAIYVVATKIPDILSGVLQDFSAVLAPRLAKYSKYTVGIDNIFRLIAFIYMGVLLGVAFFVVPWMLPLLVGPKYEEAVPYAQALTCAVALGNHAQLRFRYIRSQIDEHSFRNIVLISSIVRLTAFLVLVPLFDIVGAVVSMFIYRITMSITVREMINRHYLKI
jgi:O-antigen/teichoic acid export membrane protein